MNNTTEFPPWMQNAINSGLIDGGFLPPNPEQNFSSLAQSPKNGLAVEAVRLPENFENGYTRKTPEIPYPPSDPSYMTAVKSLIDPSFTQGNESMQPFSLAQSTMPPAPVQTAQNMPPEDGFYQAPPSHQAARSAAQGLGYTPQPNAQSARGFAMKPPKPKPNPTVYTGSPIEKDASGTHHYKSFDDFLKYLSVPEKHRPKAVSGDGKKYIPKLGKKETA